MSKQNAHKLARLRSQLREGPFEDRLRAIEALKELGDPEAIENLEEFCCIGPEKVELLLDGGQQRRMQLSYPSGRIPYSEREMLWRGLAGNRDDLQASASAAIAEIRGRDQQVAAAGENRPGENARDGSDALKAIIEKLDGSTLTRQVVGTESEIPRELDVLVAAGPPGVTLLVDRLFRDLTIDQNILVVPRWGDSAWNEWMKLGEIIDAISRGLLVKLAPYLARLVGLECSDRDFYRVLHPRLVNGLNQLGHNVSEQEEGSATDDSTGNSTVAKGARQETVSVAEDAQVIAELEKEISAPIPRRHNITFPRDAVGFEEFSGRVVALHLHGMGLTECPRGIMRLDGLKALVLSNNRISHLPEEIGGLSNLEVLYLQENQLGSVPASIGKLTKLWRLSLRMNRLSSLPSSMRQLRNLKFLNLRDNPGLGGKSDHYEDDPDLVRITGISTVGRFLDELVGSRATTAAIDEAHSLGQRQNERSRLPLDSRARATAGADSQSPPKWVYPTLGVLTISIVTLGFGIYKVVSAPPPSPLEMVWPTLIPPAPGVAVSRRPGVPATAQPIRGSTTGERLGADKGAPEKKTPGKSGKSAAIGEKRAFESAVTAPPSTRPRKGDSVDDWIDQLGTTKSDGGEKSNPKRESTAAALPPLSQGDIVSAMKAVRLRVKECYNRYKVPGTAMANMAVSEGGRTVTASVTGKFAGTPTGACVEAAAKTAKFPRCQAMHFPWPFSLD